MKNTRKALLAVSTLLSFAILSAPVSADDHGRDWGHDGGPHGHHFDHGGPDWHHGGPGPGPGRGDHHWHDGPGPGYGNSFAWQGHRFEPGRRFPHGFHGPQYRVDDWHRRGLPEPPYGHRWSYIDGNYVLVAIATGVITSIILNNAFNP